MRLEHELEVAADLALQAGRVLLRHRAGPLEVMTKEAGEVVTAADRESDSLIRDGLARAFPADAVFSEETPDTHERNGRERVWIVDPLDGTGGYVAGDDDFCVSIGLSVGGRARLGAVFAPARNELFVGAEGLGARLNGAPARVTSASDAERSGIEVSRKEIRRGLTAVPGLAPLRPLGSLAHKLARVSAGLSDGTFSLKLRKEWGACAGVALVHAAGGRATLLDGREVLFNRPRMSQPAGLVAAGGVLHPLLLEILGRARLPVPAGTGATA